MNQIYAPNWSTLAKQKGQSYDTFMRDLERYVRYDVNMKQHQETERAMKSRWVARNLGKQVVEGLGQAIAHIPITDWANAINACGEGCWEDKQFRKEWLRDNESHRAQS